MCKWGPWINANLIVIRLYTGLYALPGRSVKPWPIMKLGCRSKPRAPWTSLRGGSVVLYSIVASGNANSRAEDNTMQVSIVIAAGIQSLLFFLTKGYELFSEQQRENRGSGR